MNTVTRTLTTGALAAGLAFAPVAMSAAAASPYPQPTFSCTVTVTTTTVGQSISITCTGLPPGLIVIIVVTSTDPAIPDSAINIAGTKTSGPKTVAADGSVAGTVTLNAAGTYTIDVREQANPSVVLASQTVTVQPRASTGASGRLSSTGSEVLPIALGAGALLAAGVGTVVLVRRKNTA